MGNIDSLGGYFKYGVNVDVGYFDQQMAQYTSDKQVIDDYWDEFPTLTETEVRNDLGAFLFSGDDVFKKVSQLSGGERVRLALSKIFKTGPNFLILDEPTNHMDIVGKETLESMLKDFDGSVIFVSHDRYFIKKVATKVLDFTKDGVVSYAFGYEQYEEAREKASGDSFSFAVKEENKEVKEEKPVKPAYYNPGKERSKLERKLEKAEEKISALEEEIQALKDEMLNPEISTNYGRLSEISKAIEDKEEELLVCMEDWSEADKQLSELIN